MRTDKEIEADIIEQLAELEHEQWCEWSQAVVEGLHRVDQTVFEYRWRPKWVPYNQLPEEEKEKDRIWARKAFRICMQTARILTDKRQSNLEEFNNPSGVRETLY